MKPSSRRVSLAVASALLAIRADSGVPRFDQAGEPVVCDAVGRVEGPGYSFEIPGGLRGCHIWPRSIYVPLGSDIEDRYMLVGWSYSGSTIPSLKEFVD